MLITTLKGRGRDHWRRWHGNRFATAHLKQYLMICLSEEIFLTSAHQSDVISFTICSLLIRKNIIDVANGSIIILSYICSYKEISLIICSGKEISLMVQNVFVLIFSIFFAIRWSKISSQSSPFKCSALKRVIWGKLIIILFHIIIIIICIFIINNHHHTTKCLKNMFLKECWSHSAPIQ